MPPQRATATTAGKREKKKSAARTQKETTKALQTMDRASEIACYYGFSPLPATFRIKPEDSDAARALLGTAAKGKGSIIALPTAEEHAALFRHYEEKKLEEKPLPALFSALVNTPDDMRKKRGGKRLLLAAIGSPKSIVEALLIQTARAVLFEEGHPELCVSINSIGDRESTNRFLRELGAYYRKHLDRLPAPCRVLLQKNQTILGCPHEKCRLIAAGAPKSIASLSEGSRAHLREVLEYLEELKILYRIDHILIGPLSIHSEIIFEIRDADADEHAPPLAGGIRSNSIARRIGTHRDISYGSAVVILPPERGKGTRSRRVPMKKPTLFFLQLGNEAKLKSLGVIEVLRRAHISVCQALARDKLISQLSAQEHFETPYSLLMGQREALENTIIVRNNETRAQETVRIDELPAYLKKHKIA